MVVSPASPLAPARGLQARADRALFTGAPAISLHADSSFDRGAKVARVCQEEGLGTVHQVQLKVSSRLDRARDLTRVHEKFGGSPRALMFDASCYSGKNRDNGARTLDVSWVRFQLGLGCEFALTDSAYIGERDRKGLDSVLAQTRAIDLRAIAVLPLHSTWIGSHSALRQSFDGGSPVIISDRCQRHLADVLVHAFPCVSRVWDRHT